MTKEWFEKIKADGILKWESGLRTKYHHDWWGSCGVNKCSFCANFKCYLIWHENAAECPLQYKEGCAEPWGKLYEHDAYETRKTFLKYVKEMLELIKAVEYKEEWENF